MVLLPASMTPFTFDIVSALSLGDARLCTMEYGPWSVTFHGCCGEADTLTLDGDAIALHSWEHAAELVTGRPDALRWLAILRDDVVSRAQLRAAWDATA